MTALAPLKPDFQLPCALFHEDRATHDAAAENIFKTEHLPSESGTVQCRGLRERERQTPLRQKNVNDD